MKIILCISSLLKYVIVIAPLIIPVSCNKEDHRPRVIITTDIQTCCGGTDDIQSLCHLMWHADKLDIKAIIPEKFDNGQKSGGIAAAKEVLQKYRLDYENPQNNFKEMGFPEPDHFFNDVLVTNRDSSINRIINEALSKDKRPLYILVWGTMEILRDALLTAPEIAENIRVLSIRTNLREPSKGGDGAIPNINGEGRNRIFGDTMFDKLWWIENDWGYQGMISGLEYPEKKENVQENVLGEKANEVKEEENVRPVSGRPLEMMNIIASEGGNLGKHIKEVVSSEKTNRSFYFRATEIPTTLYLTDPNNNPNDPSIGSWAGLFKQPFPETRPNYWTNVTGDSDYDHTDPINTWRFAEKAFVNSYQYMLIEREEMYRELIERLNRIYGD